MFLANIVEKMNDNEFRKDIFTLLRPEVVYDNDLAYKKISEEIIGLIA
jgi:hypothetical protein